MKTEILYITAEYPNVGGDTAFVATEIKHIAKKFEKVYVYSHGRKDKPSIQIPSNVVVNYFENISYIIKIKYLILSFFSPIFFREIKSIFTKKKKLNCIKTALFFLFRSKLESEQMVKVIKQNEIKKLYTFWYYSSTLACILAKKKLKLTDISISTRTHRYDLYEFRNNQKYQPYKIQMDRQLNNIFFISKQGMEYYIQTFANCEKEKYKLCYLGTENQIELKEQKFSNEIQLLSVSYVVPVKRLHLIIDALSRCAKENIKINWTHIGSGSEFENIKKLAFQMLSNTSVRFNFLGQQTNEEVHNYYKSNNVDLFVNMSESEGLPVSMMEAMSFGVPVIASNVGGVSEIVDNKTGWLLSKDLCNEEFVDVIQEWNKSEVEEKLHKSNEAYKKWNTNFNAEKNYTEFVEQLCGINKNEINLP